MNGKVTLTLNNETYNVLAIVPDTNHFGKIASIYMCKPRGRNIYKTILFDNWVIRNWHFTTSGKVGDKEFAEIQAQSIPFNDDIIPPQQPEAPPPVPQGLVPVAAPEGGNTAQWNDLSAEEKAALLDVAKGKADLPFDIWNALFDKGLVDITAGRYDCLTAEGKQLVELETLRAQLDAARTDVVRLTAENRKLTLALNRAQDGLKTISSGMIGDYSPELVATCELIEVHKLLKNEVNS